jgi:Ig-like domain CHU_C associated/Secretion system C-terminal sorting domain/PKD domain
MKTIKNLIIVFFTFFLTNASIYAQYHGGDSDGATTDLLGLTSCPIPAHFYAYMGGDNDGAGVETLMSTMCTTPNSFFAYMGGNGDGAGVETISNTVCGIPPSFYAYMGGDNDGAAVETTNNTVCGFPPQFYAFFGGDSDGSSRDATAPVCPTVPPVASFTASTNTGCIGQSVTYTDTSTNIPSAWSWTFPGGTPATSTVQNPVVVYNTAGIYNVTLVATNYNGSNTDLETGFETITAFPTVSATIPASRCDSGTVNLGATASAGTLNWYATATGGTVLGTGTTFTTPSITASTTYYVEAVNATCASVSRTAVLATINVTPTVLTTTPGNRCNTGSVNLGAIASAGTLNWYANATGGSILSSGNTFTTPSISTTTTYYVEATNVTCNSSRTAVIATINTTPTITATTPASRCDTGSVTLGATASAGTINWYAASSGGIILGTGTSFTTPVISATTTYYVEAATATCSSVRSAVIATASVTPTVTATSPASRCDNGSVTLSATTSSGTVVWYNAATGGTVLSTSNSFLTPSISTTTTYYVEAVNGSCTSVRVPVIATVNSTPTVTATTPSSRCGTGTVTLGANSSAGTLNWYNVATGGTLLGSGTSFTTTSITTNTTYFVEAANGTCVSARTPVIATVNSTPTITTTTPASNCGTGIVTLGATAIAGTLNWFASSTGGTSLGSGASFVTPSISVTTTYYVDVSNGSCTSARTPVIATINSIPGITAIGNNSRCDAGTVTLSVSPSAGTAVWYATATGGTALATSNSFTTPSLTTYYAEAVNGSCTSGTRTAVVATINATPTITATTPASRCGVGTVTLSATSTGTLSWFATATGGTSIATGSSFTTPSISTTTTYYVEVSNGTCTSTRTAVVATITSSAAPTGTANQTFCSTETVGLLAVTGTNIIWYNAATGGTVVPNSTLLVAGTTYYASQNLSGCESISRLAVTVISGGCLGNETFKLDALKLYPNPVIDVLNISYTKTISKVEISNILGQIIDNLTINSNDGQVDMSRFSSGTYLVKVTADNKSETFKVIKK